MTAEELGTWILCGVFIGTIILNYFNYYKKKEEPIDALKAKINSMENLVNNTMGKLDRLCESIDNNSKVVSDISACVRDHETRLKIIEHDQERGQQHGK